MESPLTHRRASAPGLGTCATIVAALGLLAGSALAPSPASAVRPTLPPKGATPATTKPATAPTTAGSGGSVSQSSSSSKSSSRSSSKAGVAKTSSAKASSAKSSSAKSSSAKSGTSGFGNGAKGAAVQAVQERLIELKYDITDAEGQFGDQTFHAVMAFQKANGLARTGRVGSQMLAALETAADPEPMMPTGGANRVEVDLKRQILLIWENDELYRIISISSGNGKDFCSFDPETEETSCDKAITPTGSFRIQRRWVGWRESRLGEMYNPLYFTGGFAIHGSLSVPGSPASHGCVRVPMVTSEWLPSILEDGTPVYVFGAKDTDKKPTPLKSTSPPRSTALGGSTIPSGPTVPGQSTPATTTSTTTTTTTTTIVRLLNGGTPPPTSPTVPPQTAVPSTVPSTVPTGVTTTTTTAPTSAPGVTLPVG